MKILKWISFSFFLVFYTQLVLAVPQATIIPVEKLQWAPLSFQHADGSTGGMRAILEGSPLKPGLYIALIKYPAGFQTKLHVHPVSIYITVLSGDFHISFDKKADKSLSQSLPVGTFIIIPANTPHTTWTKNGVTTQVVAEGNWDIKYLD